jgi:hypothetical protein
MRASVGSSRAMRFFSRASRPRCPPIETRRLPAAHRRAGGYRSYAAATSDVYVISSEVGHTSARASMTSRHLPVLRGVRENALLSHDLFEGIFARTGLVTDIELFEESHGLRGRCGPAASMGARRLATAALDRPGGRRCRGATKPHPAHRSVEDGGQSPPHPVGSGRLADACRRLDASPPPAARVDGVRPRHDRGARPPACVRRGDTCAIRNLQADPHPRGRPELRAGVSQALWITFMAHQAWLMAMRSGGP